MLAGAPPGQGRVAQRLAELGPVWDLTTGGYFEGREGVHKLIKEMGETRCKKQLLSTGRPPVSRTSMMGEGARMARGRRQWGRMEEMKAKNEREAAWRAATTGKEVVRRGQFWLG